MVRPPRDSHRPLFSGSLMLWSGVQGGIVLIALCLVLFMGAWRGMAEETLRSLVFVTLMLGDVVLVLVNRSFDTSPFRALVRPNPVLWSVLAFDATLLTLILSFSPTRNLFRLGSVTLRDVGICIFVSLIALLIMEFMKRFWQASLKN